MKAIFVVIGSVIIISVCAFGYHLGENESKWQIKIAEADREFRERVNRRRLEMEQERIFIAMEGVHELRRIATAVEGLNNKIKYVQNDDYTMEKK